MIFEGGNIALSNARGIGQWAFLIPGIYFILIALMYITCCPIISKESRAVKVVKLAISFSTIIGLILYLLADNYHLIEQIEQDKFLANLSDTNALKAEIYGRINAIQPSFLLLSIVFYRAIPHFIVLFISKYDGRESETKNMTVWIGIINVVVLTTELDSWFTMVQNTSDCSAQVHWVWAMWVLMTVGYIMQP